MIRKISLGAVFVMAILCSNISRAWASDWTAANYNAANNNYISDASILNAVPTAPNSLEVPYNSMGQIIADGKLFFSDGLTPSTIYVYALPSLSLVWSQQFAVQVTNIVYSNGNIYFGSGSFYSLNANTGLSNWTSPVVTGYKGKVLQVEGSKVYGIRWNANINCLMVLDQTTGAILGSPTNILFDSVNEITLTPDRILLTAARYNAGGSAVVAFDRNNFQYLTSSTVCRSSSATVYDAEQNIIYITATDGAFCAYDPGTLAVVFPNRMFAMSRLVKYGDVMYSVYGRNIQYFDSQDKNAVVANITNVLDSSSAFQGHPIVVNGVLYANTNKGQLMSRNLESGELKFYDIDNTMLLQRIIYGSGQFVLTGANNGKKKFYVYNYANLGAKPAAGTISVTSPYHMEGMNQYLGQLHCHYIPDLPAWNKLWNGDPFPGFTVEKYKQAGYDFVALTEHNAIVPMPVQDESGIMQIKSAMESTQGWSKHHILAVGINEDFDNDADDQTRIDAINSQGGISIFAHPDSWFYGALTRTISKLDGVKYLEIYNNAVQKTLIQGYALDDYDKLSVLRNHKYLTAGDDYTPGDGFFDGGAVVALSSTNSQPDIMDNLKSGNFYALQGSKAPRIRNLVTNSSGLSLEVSEPSDISFIGKGGVTLKKEKNVNSATYIYQGDEIYVRAEVKAVDGGLRAWTQAIIVTPTQEETILSSGEHTTLLNQGVLDSNSTAPVSVKILDQADYPDSLPPLGYISPIYQFTTEGEVLDGNRLAISYANREIPVNASNLAIYTYDESQKHWVKTSSTIDQVNQIVTTELPHYSLYALSAELPEDTEPPTVDLVEPEALSNLSDTVRLSAMASDDQAVTSVKFIVDDKEFSSDIVASDGWGVDLDTSTYINGNHKLTLVAEDFSGNIAERKYDITIDGGIVAPSVVIDAPSSSEYLYEMSGITGHYTSQLSVESIGVYLDDVFIENAEINPADKTFSKSIDWKNIKEGEHRLKLELRDVSENFASAELYVHVGQQVQATIISPTSRNYLRSGQIPISVEIVPAAAPVDIYVDGVKVINNSGVELANFSFGEHVIEVKFGDMILASTAFSVVTNYDDTVELVRKLYSDGHIKNYGIVNSIIVRLQLAELLHKVRLYKLERLFLVELEKFVVQQNKQRKPLLDGFSETILQDHIIFLRALQ